MPAVCQKRLHVGLECACGLPLYWVVARLNPTRLGSRNVFFVASHVPSPTFIVFEVYELLPAGASCGDGDIMPGDRRVYLGEISRSLYFKGLPYDSSNLWGFGLPVDKGLKSRGAQI